MASQLRGEYDAKSERMEQYLQMALPLLAGFKHFEVIHIPKSKNQLPNALTNLASSLLYPCNVELSVIDRPSIPNVAVITIDHRVEPSWMTPILEYLKNGALP